MSSVLVPLVYCWHNSYWTGSSGLPQWSSHLQSRLPSTGIPSTCHLAHVLCGCLFQETSLLGVGGGEKMPRVRLKSKSQLIPFWRVWEGLFTSSRDPEVAPIWNAVLSISHWPRSSWRQRSPGLAADFRLGHREVTNARARLAPR